MQVMDKSYKRGQKANCFSSSYSVTDLYIYIYGFGGE